MEQVLLGYTKNFRTTAHRRLAQQWTVAFLQSTYKQLPMNSTEGWNSLLLRQMMLTGPLYLNTFATS
jgi:hypothetical protein